MIPGESERPPLAEQVVLVTDAPVVFAPCLLATASVAPLTGFELRADGRPLAVASLSPVPAATLTGEGGFKPPPEFAWSAAAEDELAARLGRLMG